MTDNDPKNRFRAYAKPDPTLPDWFNNPNPANNQSEVSIPAWFDEPEPSDVWGDTSRSNDLWGNPNPHAANQQTSPGWLKSPTPEHAWRRSAQTYQLPPKALFALVGFIGLMALWIGWDLGLWGRLGMMTVAMALAYFKFRGPQNLQDRSRRRKQALLSQLLIGAIVLLMVLVSLYLRSR